MLEKLPLIIPVENQLRELDAKLLLAACAAEQGIACYIGYRTEIDIMISRLPPSIYLAKSVTPRSDKMFHILARLGHIICAWDEEALVPYPNDIYFSRRLSARALTYVSHLFAWGNQNENLFKAYAGFPKNLPVHTVGNPRFDILRRQLRPFYDGDIKDIKNRYGNFILINTNFGNINAHLPVHNLFIKKDKHGKYTKPGRGAAGMSREFAEGRAKFKHNIYQSFLSLIPALAKRFADMNIIIRPHPIENRQPYQKLAAALNNAHVVQKGNIIPWIHAATAIIHNGCTTGLEACLSKKTAIAYEVETSSRYGDELPNQASHRCASIDEVIASIVSARAGRLPVIDVRQITDRIAFEEDTLCCQKIVSIIGKIRNNQTRRPAPADTLAGAYLARKRMYSKRIQGLFAFSKYHKSFQEVRFPTLSEARLQVKIEKFSDLLNIRKGITVRQVYPHIFQIQ